MGSGFVVVCGNLGVGKTTLSNLLCAATDSALCHERVDDNPYLSKFYADPATWVVKLNVFFLAVRARAMLDASRADRLFILDRCLYEDIVFARVALDEGTIDEQYYNVFLDLYNVLIATLEPPAAMIYLHAGPPTLHHRILARGRHFEMDMSMSYLVTIQRRYDEWISEFEMCPVIRVDTESTDYRHDGAALQSLIRNIRVYWNGAG